MQTLEANSTYKLSEWEERYLTQLASDKRLPYSENPRHHSNLKPMIEEGLIQLDGKDVVMSELGQKSLEDLLSKKNLFMNEINKPKVIAVDAALKDSAVKVFRGEEQSIVLALIETVIELKKEIAILKGDAEVDALDTEGDLKKSDKGKKKS